MDEQHLDALPPVNVSVPLGGQANPMEDTDKNSEQAVKSTQQSAGGFADPSALGPLPLGTASLPPQGQGASSGVASTSTPPIADDSDLIEKEWVEKAKQIVEQTKSDPHQQNEAITKMRVDYLKKRYNRDIDIKATEA